MNNDDGIDDKYMQNEVDSFYSNVNILLHRHDISLAIFAHSHKNRRSMIHKLDNYIV